MSSKSHHSHSRSRRATVPARRRGRVTRRAHKKKFASRDVADADPRPRASFARAVPSLSLSSLAPPSRLAPRRPDARASRAGETRRRRVRATTRSGDRRRERARRGREVDGVHPSMIRASAERRARVRPTRRRVSIVAPRRANARWRRAAGARSSRRRRVDRVERARVSSSVSSLTTGCPPSANQSINHSRVPERRRARSTPRVAARSRCVRDAFVPSIDSTRLSRATDTGASVRAELEQTPPPPPRVPPSTEHHHPSPTPRLDRPNAIDRSIDRRASLDSRLAVESDVFSPHSPRRRKQSSEKPPRRHSTNHHTHRRLHRRASRTPPRNTES